MELPIDANLTKEMIRKLRQAMQYTLTGGRGEEVVECIEIEGVEDVDIPMNKAYRRCAGVKVLKQLYLTNDIK
jgi:hypothetical protein